MATNNLREQLLKAGLVTEDQVQQAERDAQPKAKPRGKSPRGERGAQPKNGRGEDPGKRDPAKKRRKKKSRRGEDQSPPPDPRALLLELFRLELVAIREGTATLNYTVDGDGRVRRVTLDVEQHRTLIEGEAALVAIDAEVRGLLALENSPRTFGRRSRRVYSGGPATSTQAPEQAELGLLPRTAAERLLEIDRARILFFNRERRASETQSDAAEGDGAEERAG